LENDPSKNKPHIRLLPTVNRKRSLLNLVNPKKRKKDQRPAPTLIIRNSRKPLNPSNCLKIKKNHYIG
jgi:hypothetical protein